MLNTNQIGSRDVAVAALRVASTSTLEEEKREIAKMLTRDIKVAAANYGGEFPSSVGKIIERTIVAAKREGIIAELHNEEGAVAGATHEAISQIMSKAMGLNVGGKISVARYGDHISVAILFGVGLLHLNDIVVGMGHRAV